MRLNCGPAENSESDPGKDLVVADPFPAGAGLLNNRFISTLIAVPPSAKIPDGDGGYVLWV